MASHSLTHHLVSNLKRLRKSAGLTQQELADVAHIPRATLASMEQGAANPGLDSVMAVASALKVGLDELVSPPPEHRFFKVSAFQAKEMHDDQGRYIARMLSPLGSRGVQIQHVRLMPGCRATGRSHPIGAQEFFFSYAATARLIVAGEDVDVEPGALVQFPGHYPHVYANPGIQMVEAFSVVILAG